MTILDDMWEALEAHQHIAEQKGYGKEWASMCRERTVTDAEAAGVAAWSAWLSSSGNAAEAVLNATYATEAASEAASESDIAAYEASWHAAFVVDADTMPAVVVLYAERAIQHITIANDGLAYVRSKLTEG